MRIVSAPRLRSHRSASIGAVAVGTADAAPTPLSYDFLQHASRQLDAQIAKWRAVEQQDFPTLEEAAAAAGWSGRPSGAAR